MAATSAKTERNRAIYVMRNSGATFREIGEKFGIGTCRARQIYQRERHSIEGCKAFVSYRHFGGSMKLARYCTYCGKPIAG